MTYNKDLETASGHHVVHHFLSRPFQERLANNWVSGGHIPRTNTYINGMMLMIDRDYEMGYLLEVCDNDENGDTWVTHLFIAHFHAGLDPDNLRWEWHEHRPYRFGERPADLTSFDIMRTFVSWYEQVIELRCEPPALHRA